MRRSVALPVRGLCIIDSYYRPLSTQVNSNGSIAEPQQGARHRVLFTLASLRRYRRTLEAVQFDANESEEVNRNTARHSSAPTLCQLLLHDSDNK